MNRFLPQAIDSDPARPAPQALTVSQVVARIRSLIEQQFPAALWVEGELSNCSFPASGHIYFSLVDDQVTDRFGQRLVLPCAFFKNANQRLAFKLEDGQKVLCLGQVTTYEGRGQYQLRVLRVEPRGIGALQLAFEQLKKRLQAEGLFDEARKRPIPKLPRRVGLITSLSGSVVHDMVARLRGRLHVLILPVKVQGEGAAEEIAEAIRLANGRRIAEVLIVARGGGSLEELWAFNEERVARAIFSSTIPVISAVGHEDHWTIADYVADLRASTPTHAAQLLAHEQQQLIQQAQQWIEELLDGMQRFLEDQAQRLDGLQGRLRLLHPLAQLERCLARRRDLSLQLTNGMRYAMDRHDRHLQGLIGRLDALSPLAVLARGYSITRRLPQGGVVTSAGQVHAGEELETLLAHGRITSTVVQTHPSE
ncbi:MAG: exodeoxyribonuclease VII large subunit [Candidatus Omnitrophica bacterium]|nr:exodeoxyribonuclease VII large subunit [Candidatus Omnitrophota bacterium]